jgi:phage tail sheath gpL-like
VSTQLILTSKWKGATSAEINAYFKTGDKSCGITYSEASKVNGTGAAVLTDALAGLGSEWNTIVINPYGTAAFDAIEAINGIPDPENPTGRYSGTSFLPFISIWGSTEDNKDDLVAITDASARKSQVTHALAPAPLSKGMSWEAAANMAYHFALINQNSPHLDINSKQYPDMPIPSDELIGDMSDYNNRDFWVKKGCSTVELKNGKYTVVDFITTYHPDGEINPTYQYCRNLNVYWNLVFGLKLMDANFIVDKAIVSNDQSVNVANVIKPKEVIQLTRSYADDLGQRALISEVDFMKDSILCDVSATNPNRLDRSFRVKISGIARIVSTDLEVGFAFGS